MKISESSISKPENIPHLGQIGFQGFLTAENFMRSPQLGENCKQFIQQVNANISL